MSSKVHAKRHEPVAVGKVLDDFYVDESVRFKDSGRLRTEGFVYLYDAEEHNDVNSGNWGDEDVNPWANAA